jgi:hypothetical protein
MFHTTVMKLVLNENSLLSKNKEKSLTVRHWLDNFLIVVGDFRPDNHFTFLHMNVNLSIDIVDNFLSQLNVLIKVMNLSFEDLNSLVRTLIKVSQAYILLKNVFEH